MPVSVSIAKLCVCAAAGALVGGSAVHVASKPKPRPRVAHVVPKKPLARPASITAPAPLPCEPMMTPELAVRVPAAVYDAPSQDRPAARLVMPISAAVIYPADEPVPEGMDSARLSVPTDVPEPAALGLLGAGFLGVATWRWTISARRR